MAFTEDLDTYFADFTDTVVYSSTTYKGILDQPDEMIADGLVVTTDSVSYTHLTLPTTLPV